MYPEHDDQFEEWQITRVEAKRLGDYDIFNGGLGLWCGKDCPVAPKAGQTARLYGRGVGSTVRGLFIDGVKVWYRTEAEDKEYGEIQSYGADAADWLKRWDDGRSVWSIEMGGLGPGYEQCIHMTAAEILRWFLEHKPDASLWEDAEIWRTVRGEMDKAVMALPLIDQLGLSGAQWGAACNVACNLYKRGPREMMKDPAVKDRHIQVSRRFPGMAA